MSNTIYDKHSEEWDKVLSDPTRKDVGESWFRKDTLDYWRHARMRAALDLLVAQDKDASWLTVGDGRFGTDAHYLLSLGAQKVHCSDISDTLLKIGHEKGFITSYSAENAEELQFKDSSFDYVFCKEALHHFPRPYIALHEMFRVCKKAVILIEPRDRIIDKPIFSMLSFLLRTLLGRETAQHDFEPVGNYVYSISEREIEKFLLGIHHAKVAFKGANDAYIPNIELVPLNSSAPSDKKLRNALYKKIKRADFFSRVGLTSSTLLSAVLFKESPTSKLISEMEKDGWSIKDLPTNPYR